MFEKNLNIAYLLDFYGDVLSEHMRRLLEMYYNEDLSLSEIAECVGISRQGVRHTLKKGEEELLLLEEKLGLAARYADMTAKARQLLSLATAAEAAPADEERVLALVAAARECASLIGERSLE